MIDQQNLAEQTWPRSQPLVQAGEQKWELCPWGQWCAIATCHHWTGDFPSYLRVIFYINSTHYLLVNKVVSDVILLLKWSFTSRMYVKKSVTFSGIALSHHRNAESGRVHISTGRSQKDVQSILSRCLLSTLLVLFVFFSLRSWYHVARKTKKVRKKSLYSKRVTTQQSNKMISVLIK